MKARNLLFSVILLGNLAVANTTVLAEETTGTVTAQTTSSSEIGIENDTESTLQSATVSENTVSIYLESKEAIMANLLRCLLRNMSMDNGLR